MSNSQLLIFLLMTPLLSNCAILLGTVKPPDEKAENYEVTPLSEMNSDWVELDHDDSNNDEDGSDLVFQSRTTASIISLNSACRTRNESTDRNLKEFADLLLLGIEDIKEREEEETRVAGAQALQTTILGSMGGERMKLRTVVLKKGSCIYDLMYVARPDKFERQESDFKQFVTSLKLD